MADISQELEEIANSLSEENFLTPRGVKVHECSKYAQANVGLSGNDFQNGEAMFGTMTFHEGSKRWWIGNGVQASPIFFCPYCGLELRKLHWMQ